MKITIFSIRTNSPVFAEIGILCLCNRQINELKCFLLINEIEFSLAVIPSFKEIE